MDGKRRSQRMAIQTRVSTLRKPVEIGKAWYVQAGVTSHGPLMREP
jgi:hypothetical protein